MAKKPAISATRQRHLHAIQQDREKLLAGLSGNDELVFSAKCTYLANHVAIRLQTIYSLYLFDSLGEHAQNVERYYMEPFSFSQFLSDSTPCMLDVDEAKALLSVFDKSNTEELAREHKIDWEEFFGRVRYFVANWPLIGVVLGQLPPLIVLDDGEWPLQITFDWPEPNTP